MNFVQFIELGGVVGYCLVIMSVIGITTILWKAWSIYKFNAIIQQTLPQLIIRRIQVQNPDHHVLMDSVRSEITLAFKPMYQGLTTLENIATSAPLLGLLGTVMGIFQAFSQIVSLGMDDPAVFADGIRLALVTTVIGLVVAIPHLIAYNYLNARLENEQDEVESEVIAELAVFLKEKE